MDFLPSLGSRRETIERDSIVSSLRFGRLRIQVPFWGSVPFSSPDIYLKVSAGADVKAGLGGA